MYTCTGKRPPFWKNHISIPHSRNRRVLFPSIHAFLVKNTNVMELNESSILFLLRIEENGNVLSVLINVDQISHISLSPHPPNYFFYFLECS